MLDVLTDLLWWCTDRSWRGLRMLSGDDAYDRYLADFEGRGSGAAPLSRGAFHEQQLDRKWDRIFGCGRG
jgi:uncharacterized short protein YbdD (DUF466 family)